MSIVINIIGLSLLFIGNMLVTSAVTKFNAREKLRFKWGNRLQALGFILSLIGIALEVVPPQC